MKYNHRHVDFLLDGSEYYDFELATDDTQTFGDSLYDDGLVINVNICSGLTSTVRWTGATVGNFELDYITTTGLDNYFVDVPNAYSGGTIDTSIVAVFTTGDTFEFFPVSGWSTTVSYEITSQGACLKKLNGGFYQGFFKLHEYPYEMMPARVHKGWTVDMIVKYPNVKTGTGTTLNDLYPQNGGFIFYMGTRAEDKYWNGFTTGETAVLFNWSGLTITDPRYQIYYGQPVNFNNGGVDMNHYNPYPSAGVGDYLYYQTSNMGYGMFPYANQGNVYGGFTVGYAYGGGGTMTYIYPELSYSPLYTYGDEFVTSGGTSYEGYYHYYNHRPYVERYYSNNTQPLFPKYPWKNITDNAFGVRITDDGRIGYRVLRVGNICQTGTTMNYSNGETYTFTGTTTPVYKLEEAYSTSPIFTAGNTGYINITIVFDRYIELNDCELIYDVAEKYRKGTLTIYVNARPVFQQENFVEIIPHALDRQKELQNAVPFNLSWGGGTQGLMESVTFGGIDTADRNLMLQQHFTGTWMGSLQTFKMYIKPLSVPQIIHNFLVRKPTYNMAGDFGGRYIFITKG